MLCSIWCATNTTTKQQQPPPSPLPPQTIPTIRIYKQSHLWSPTIAINHYHQFCRSLPPTTENHLPSQLLPPIPVPFSNNSTCLHHQLPQISPVPTITTTNSRNYQFPHTPPPIPQASTIYHFYKPPVEKASCRFRFSDVNVDGNAFVCDHISSG